MDVLMAGDRVIVKVGKEIKEAKVFTDCKTFRWQDPTFLVGVIQGGDGKAYKINYRGVHTVSTFMGNYKILGRV